MWNILEWLTKKAPKYFANGSNISVNDGPESDSGIEAKVSGMQVDSNLRAHHFFNRVARSVHEPAEIEKLTREYLSQGRQYTSTPSSPKVVRIDNYRKKNEEI